jgi:hypothetical protein
VKSAAEKGLSAEARKWRDALETELGKLREEKASMPEEEYLRKLEKVLVELAKSYRGGGQKPESEDQKSDSRSGNGKSERAN